MVYEWKSKIKQRENNEDGYDFNLFWIIIKCWTIGQNIIVMEKFGFATEQIHLCFKFKKSEIRGFQESGLISRQ